MSEPDEASTQLDDAIEVMRAKRQIDDAVAELASRPLNERAASRMREALADPSLTAARAALRRLDTNKPLLRAVPNDGGAL